MPPRRTLLVLLLLAACAREPPAPPAPPSTVQWQPVEGAERYRVRAFAGDHLLFETSSGQAQLDLDAAMQRACARFDTVVLVVRALEVEAAPQRIRIRP